MTEKQQFIDTLTHEFATKIALLFVTPRERICWLLLQEKFQNILNEMDELLTPQKCLEVQKLYLEMQQQIVNKGLKDVGKDNN